MNFETPSTSDETVENENEALKQNINSLIELFQVNERGGLYSSDDKTVIEIGRIIQKYTTNVENGYNHIGDPEAFLSDVHIARDKMLENTVDEKEKQYIREMFKHVDIPE